MERGSEKDKHEREIQAPHCVSRSHGPQRSPPAGRFTIEPFGRLVLSTAEKEKGNFSTQKKHQHSQFMKVRIDQYIQYHILNLCPSPSFPSSSYPLKDSSCSSFTLTSLAGRRPSPATAPVHRFVITLASVTARRNLRLRTTYNNTVYPSKPPPSPRPSTQVP